MPVLPSDRSFPAVPVLSLIDFYREEFVKHQQCLAAQREYFSEHAIRSVEDALGRIIAEIDVLTHKADADVVVARLLQEFDVVTRLSAWTDPHRIN
ncbi:MAG: hypothetical protein R2708_23155 [Vicinamibacterales bacterium]